MKLIPLFLLVGMLGVSGWAEEAEPELVQKAEAGDAKAQCALGNYFKGRNINEAFKWYTKSAEQGNAEGQRSLGNCYNFGEGIKQDKGKAVEWYTKSAEQGNADAQYDLHGYYSIKANEYIRTTDNLPRIEEARKIADEWCLKAANGGNRSAQRQLGSDYFYNSRSKGAARIEELEEAKKWYTKAAEGGYKQAEKMASNCEFDIQKIQRQLKTTKSK